MFKHNFSLTNGPKMQNNAFFGKITLKTGCTYKNGDFFALLVLGSAHISENTTYNLGMVVLLRGRTSVSEMRFSIYGIILKQPKTAIFSKIVIFLALPVILEGYMSQNTPYNSLAVLLRGRTSFQDAGFSKYKIFQKQPFLAQKSQIQPKRP